MSVVLSYASANAYAFIVSNTAVFSVLQADEGDSGNGSQGFRMPTSKKGSAAVVGFTLKF